MKKRFLFLLLLLSVLLSSCTVTIPNSVQAEEKMNELGYTVSKFTQYGKEVEHQNITQVTVLNADKGEDFIQVYFFANEEDTDTFFKERSSSLMKDVEVVKKNKYSIYRGTEKAIEDFLS